MSTVLFVMHHFCTRLVCSIPFVVAVAIGATACSGSVSDESEPVVVTTTSTTSFLASSSTTTEPPTSSTAEPASTIAEPEWTDEELAVIQAHDMFRRELVRVFVEPGSDAQLLFEMASPEVVDSLRANVAELRSDGSLFSGTDQFRSTSVQFVEPDIAEVVACGWDQTTRTLDGAVIDAPDIAASTSVTRMQLVNEQWVFAGVIPDGSEEPCELF